MPDPMAEVNAQHLRAMGLDPDMLGKPLPPSTKDPRANEGRCPSESGVGRCAALEGHSGSHYRGRVTWRDDEVHEQPDAQPLRQEDAQDV